MQTVTERATTTTMQNENDIRNNLIVYLSTKQRYGFVACLVSEPAQCSNNNRNHMMITMQTRRYKFSDRLFSSASSYHITYLHIYIGASHLGEKKFCNHLDGVHILIYLLCCGCCYPLKLIESIR